MDLIATLVLVLDVELLQFTSHMVSCTGISIPIGVNTICRRRGSSDMLLLWGVIFFETMPTLSCGVALLEADLAGWGQLLVVVLAFVGGLVLP